MASKYFACAFQRGWGQEVQTPLENHKFVRPSVKYVGDSKNNKITPKHQDPTKFLVLHMFWVVQIFWVNKLISVNCGHNESARKHQNLSTS